MRLNQTLCILCLLFFGSRLYSQANSVNYNGIVNDNAVRIRDTPSLGAKIVGQLNQGMSVTVLGRSQNRMFLDGCDSYWLKIKKDNTEGWSYGAYINLLDSQYDTLSVLSANGYVGAVDLNYSRNLPTNELIQKERDTLRLQATRFSNCSIKEYYDAIVKAFIQQQSLRPFFLNTQWVGVTETDRFIILSSSTLSDYIQASYSDNITIGPLIIKNETSASFVINGFRKRSDFSGFQTASVAINIKKIKDTRFSPLNGKTIIDYVSICPYSAEDFIKQSWGDINYFYSFMTSGTFHDGRYSNLLQMILD